MVVPWGERRERPIAEAIGATEDAATGRAARPGGTDSISPNPPSCAPSASRVDVPDSGDALQLALTELLELDSRTGDEISHSGRDKYLSCAGRGRHPRTDRNRDARELAVVELALARVHAGAQLEPDPTDALDNRLGTANRPRRPVESGEETV